MRQQLIVFSVEARAVETVDLVVEVVLAPGVAVVGVATPVEVVGVVEGAEEAL